MSSNSTSLHIAIQNGNMEIIKMLLADGCESLYTRNAEGQTPLDLATAMNNEELVRLLLEHGAGHVPPQSPPSDFAPVILDTEQRKKRIGFWTILVCVTLGASAFGDMFYSLITTSIETADYCSHNTEKLKNVVDMLYFLFFALPVCFAYLGAYVFWVFRLWEEIPRRFARTTPGVAAGLSLVPFFNFYWMFVALGGLYQDMNKVLEAYGHHKRFNTTLITASCFIWLAFHLFVIFLCLLFLILAVVDPNGGPSDSSSTVATIFGFLWYVFTVVICWIIRRNVFEFMDIKRSLEG